MLGIRGKLNLAFGILMVLLLIVSLIAISVFHLYSSAVDRMGVMDLDSIVAASKMHDAVNALSEAVQDALRTSQPPDGKGIDAASSAFDDALSLQFKRITLPDEQQLTGDIQTNWTNVVQALDAVKAASANDRPTVIEGQFRPAIRELRLNLSKLSQLNASSMKARHDEVGPTTELDRWELYATISVALVAAVVFAVTLGRRITHSLRAVTAAAKAVQAGDLEQHLPPSGRDEFGRLIETFNQMNEELRRFRALDAEKLQRSYQTTQTAIDSLPDGVILVNENGKVELANQTATRLFGVRGGQENLRDFAAWLRTAVERPSPTLDSYGTSVKVTDGEAQRYFLPQSVALWNNDGRRIGSTIILTDVTDFRRLDELKDSLLSMASHELKTPLTSMRMILPLLLEQNVGGLNEKQVDLLRVVCDATERMRGIVEHILDIGRMASGKMPMDARPVAPAQLIERAVAAQRPAFAQEEVELRVEVAGDLPLVSCDAGQVDHVLTNLLSNALHYTSPSGKVTVSAAVFDDTVIFAIKDTGCGIDSAHLPRIFETFYRVPGQRSDSGMGPGLALVKQIVESHGGRVSVGSVVGQGSTFSFTLPVAHMETAAASVNNQGVSAAADSEFVSNEKELTYVRRTIAHLDSR